MSEEQFNDKFQQLTPKPKSVLILMLEGKNDHEIAREIGTSEPTVRKHIQNLCDHFEIPTEIAGIRKNRRQELISLGSKHLPELSKDRMDALQKLQEQIAQVILNESLTTKTKQIKEPQDWGGAPDVSVFYGRQQELNQLENWILTENCRLIALLGMAGIGKTAITVRLAQNIQEEFDFLIWRSLRNAPSVEVLIVDWLKFLSGQSKFNSSLKLDDLISQLLERLREVRALLLLDNFDTILKSGDFAGQYQDGYLGYGQLLKRLGEEPSESCLILTSSEKPREIALLEGETLPVRSLQLHGLGQDAKEILKAKGLSAQEQWENLVELYRGNPLALKMVASTIGELFAGNTADFLKISSTGLVQDIISLIEQQFQRLSPLEKEIMYWLALVDESVDLASLRENISISELELFTAVKSLAERSLLEKGSGKFNLQPVVKEYVKTQLVNHIVEEIKELSKTEDLHNLKFLKNYPIHPETTPLSLVNMLRAKLPDHSEEKHLFFEKILNNLAGHPELEVGYSVSNIQNILNIK